MSLTIGMPAIIILTIIILTIAFSKYSDNLVLYALAAAVSLVGIHIHIGISFYLSRIVMISFLCAASIKYIRGVKTVYATLFLSRFVILFSLIVLFQIISTLLSPRIPEGIRQVAIHAALMALFIIVIAVSTNIESIIKAIKIYLGIGLLQSIYGIYQVIGGRFNWVTYQKILTYLNIPTTNDHTSNGYIFSSLYNIFRALGFYPADVSHYAGYLVGVIVLAASFLSYNRRLVWTYIIIVFGFCAILLSFSRSGMLTLLFIGIPALLFLLTFIKRGAAFQVGKLLLMPMLAGVILSYLIFNAHSLKINLGDAQQTQQTQQTQILEVLVKRYGDIFTNLFQNKIESLNEHDKDISESLNEHVQTRLAGLKAFSENPFLGVGLGVNASPWTSKDYPRGWGGSHSYHLDMLGQTGLIGVILQTIFMILVGKYMWMGFNIGEKDDLSRHILAGLMASFIAIIIGNFLYAYFTLDIVWFLVGSGVALSRLRILSETNSIRNKSWCDVILKV